MFFCYILYSNQLDRYYIGSTSNSVQERLTKHLNGYYGEGHYTSKSNDWIVFYKIACTSSNQARRIELHIKRMKSRDYIINLKKYPNVESKLLTKYN